MYNTYKIYYIGIRNYTHTSSLTVTFTLMRITLNNVEITGQLWHVLTQQPVKCVWLNFVYTILTFFFASPRDLEPRKLFRNRLNGYNFISFRFFLFIIVITLLFLLFYTLYNPIHYKRVLSRSCKSGS